MSHEIYQIAWLLVNRISTRIPAMKARELSELLWWIDYYSDSDERLEWKLNRARKVSDNVIPLEFHAS